MSNAIAVQLRKQLVLCRSTVVEWAAATAHDAYEAAAPKHGWVTQKASRVHWPDVPESNKATMRDALRPVVDRWLWDLDAITVSHDRNCAVCANMEFCEPLHIVAERLEEWGVITREELLDGPVYA